MYQFDQKYCFFGVMDLNFFHSFERSKWFERAYYGQMNTFSVSFAGFIDAEKDRYFREIIPFLTHKSK